MRLETLKRRRNFQEDSESEYDVPVLEIRRGKSSKEFEEGD